MKNSILILTFALIVLSGCAKCEERKEIGMNFPKFKSGQCVKLDPRSFYSNDFNILRVIMIDPISHEKGEENYSYVLERVDKKGSKWVGLRKVSEKELIPVECPKEAK